jgi:YfiR/HmsC-like
VPLVFKINGRPARRWEALWGSCESFRKQRGAAHLALILTLHFVPCPAGAQDSITAEYRLKASFLTTFPSFIDWPAKVFPSAQAPFLVCVLGDYRFGTMLAEVARTTSPQGRRVEVRWVRRDEEARNCQILFVSESEVKRYAQVLRIAQGQSILTVGETSDFLGAGGMLSFVFESGSLQFEINLAAANAAHLRVSSRLLALARRVLNNPESSVGDDTAGNTSRKVG